MPVTSFCILRSHLLQLSFYDEGVDQFFDYGFIIIGELFNGFKLLEQFCIFKGGFSLLIFIAAYQEVNRCAKCIGQFINELAGGCTPLISYRLIYVWYHL